MGHLYKKNGMGLFSTSNINTVITQKYSNKYDIKILFAKNVSMRVIFSKLEFSTKILHTYNKSNSFFRLNCTLVPLFFYIHDFDPSILKSNTPPCFDYFFHFWSPTPFFNQLARKTLMWQYSCGK
jgi:hypothetical protein